LWLGELKSIEDTICNDSMPISLNHFKKSETYARDILVILKYRKAPKAAIEPVSIVIVPIGGSGVTENG
jgi:hypothetical protein